MIAFRFAHPWAFGLLAVGGWLARTQGPTGLFAACAVATLVWFVVAWPMKAPAPKG